jgi:hypothetical protein
MFAKKGGEGDTPQSILLLLLKKERHKLESKYFSFPIL